MIFPSWCNEFKQKNLLNQRVHNKTLRGKSEKTIYKKGSGQKDLVYN